MLKNEIIINYIRKLNNESARIFTLRFGIIFSEQEINIFLPYLKKYSPLLINLQDPKKRIHEDLDSLISVNSVNKLCTLFDKLGY